MASDAATGWREADVTINGRRLSVGQALALRVAVEAMRRELENPAFRTGLGTGLAASYEARLSEIARLLLSTP